ncbi:Protein of unknown function DUF827, plant [Cynara cardunculus var. scolymus]|uniref:WEB family n=1 Tax=Cynara cardunculus var. scolymus TaxID=59895 RepID=A0A103Y523_CYNCS|nr:Protein of unknown function DUF827, plant [Cynara cardunculus var. scolymus]
MDSYEDNRTYRARELYVLSDKIEELHRTNEELKQAKDEAMQSWLDSRPLIDELERLQSGLADAKEQSDNGLVSKLESELMEIHLTIRAKKEEELKAGTEINHMTRASEALREEMERIKLETDEIRRTRSKMRKGIKLRRQRLRTLKLTLRAVRLESEAYAASAAAAVDQIGRARSLDHTDTIELTQEDYFALTRRAKEETSLADWRVVVATEQRVVAEESRDSALKKLTDPYGSVKEGEISDKEVTGFRSKPGTPFPRARAKQMAHGGIKKKRSIFIEIKSYFARKIKYLFG